MQESVESLALKLIAQTPDDLRLAKLPSDYQAAGNTMIYTVPKAFRSDDMKSALVAGLKEGVLDAYADYHVNLPQGFSLHGWSSQDPRLDEANECLRAVAEQKGVRSFVAAWGSDFKALFYIPDSTMRFSLDTLKVHLQEAVQLIESKKASQPEPRRGTVDQRHKMRDLGLTL